MITSGYSINNHTQATQATGYNIITTTQNSKTAVGIPGIAKSEKKINKRTSWQGYIKVYVLE